MNTSRIYVWCGPVGLVLFFVGMLEAHLIPLPSAGESATQIARFLTGHRVAIGVGGFLIMTGAALFVPWAAALAWRVHQLDPSSPAAFCQLGLGCLIALEVIVPIMILEAAALRPGRSPTEVQALSDVCWIMFVGLGFTFVVEAILMGLWTYGNSTKQQVFPRWSGSVAVVCGLLLIPSEFVSLNTTGPFAWNGLLSFWLAAVAVSVWMLTETWLILRSTERAPAVIHSSP
jgi:hypothetical protein